MATTATHNAFNAFLLSTNVLSSLASVPDYLSEVRLDGYGYFNNLRGLRRTLTDEEKASITPTDTYTWGDYTCLLAIFQQTLQGGSVTNPIGTGIDHFEIVRENIDDGIFVSKDKNVSGDDRSYVDITAVKNIQYRYRIYPIASDNTIITEIISAPFTLDYYYWVLIDEITNESFILDSNLTSGAFSTNTSTTAYEGVFSEYPTIFKTPKKSKRGSITVWAQYYDDDCLVTNDIDYLDRLRTVIENGNYKILKDRLGRAYRVQTSDYQEKFQDVLPNQVSQITFNFKEVSEVDE